MSEVQQTHTCVITGASSGIGAATARTLHSQGHRIALLARRGERIRALAAELGERALAVEADVTDRDSLVGAAEAVRAELGRTDILINNAGVMLLGPFGSEQRADYRPMIEVNLLGVITATEVFLPQLRDGGGQLINVSSVAARIARPGNAVYAATKWGLGGFTEALRQELHPDIRVSLIEPGAVATELAEHITHAETKQMVKESGREIAIAAEEIAEIIAFVISRPASVTLNDILVRPSAQLR
ncbi:MAG TPA: SDR family oxidoreductase [Solirubrobacteraceae bacterium]|nr:SDR family oxidoreductase [Solirubrobacteraceae bacterium]